MKIKVSVTVDLDREQVKTLVRIAKDSGHSFDGCKASGKLIRRLLTAAVEERVAYCHERAER